MIDSPFVLPDQSQGELCAAREVCLAGDRAESTAGGSGVRWVERRAIEKVEKLAPQLKVNPLGNVVVFEDRKIHVIYAMLAESRELRRERTDILRQLLLRIPVEP